MNDTTMPVTEVVSQAHDGDIVAYEFAYHILPTVAEGEVEAITKDLKAILTNQGAVLIDEEAPARFELAYEIEKYLEGKYRRFASAYFGWIRFTLEPDKLITINEEMTSYKTVLRYLIIRLTAVEEANPFRFHEALATLNPKVTNEAEDDNIKTEVVANTSEVSDDNKEESKSKLDSEETNNA